jgi:hypothetical protein
MSEALYSSASEDFSVCCHSAGCGKRKTYGYIHPSCCVLVKVLSDITTMAMPWLRRLVTGLSPQRPWLVHVEFVVDKVALEQDFYLSSSVFPCQ